MNKLYKEGSERINSDLNIVSILKRLRNFEHFLELKFKTSEMYAKFHHGKFNLINLDEDSNFEENLHSNKMIKPR